MRISLTRAVVLVVAAGCASASGRTSAESNWPLGNDAQFRAMQGVTYGAPAHVRLLPRTPVYAVFLELRPTLDSLDVRLPVGWASVEAVRRQAELVASMPTVDRPPAATASRVAMVCSNVKMGAGDPAGQEVCPVSRGDGTTGARDWWFRQRVFLLLSDRPFDAALPNAIAWRSRRTAPPVSEGSRWTVVPL
jgi:hypothetical protein